MASQFLFVWVKHDLFNHISFLNLSTLKLLFFSSINGVVFVVIKF